jgi:hypothetical protein
MFDFILFKKKKTQTFDLKYKKWRLNLEENCEWILLIKTNFQYKMCIINFDFIIYWCT